MPDNNTATFIEQSTLKRIILKALSSTDYNAQQTAHLSLHEVILAAKEVFVDEEKIHHSEQNAYYRILAAISADNNTPSWITKLQHLPQYLKKFSLSPSPIKLLPEPSPFPLPSPSPTPSPANTKSKSKSKSKRGRSGHRSSSSKQHLIPSSRLYTPNHPRETITAISLSGTAPSTRATPKSSPYDSQNHLHKRPNGCISPTRKFGGLEDHPITASHIRRCLACRERAVALQEDQENNSSQQLRKKEKIK